MTQRKKKQLQTAVVDDIIIVAPEGVSGVSLAAYATELITSNTYFVSWSEYYEASPEGPNGRAVVRLSVCYRGIGANRADVAQRVEKIGWLFDSHDIPATATIVDKVDI